MFESLSERISATFDRLTRKGVLTEADVARSMQDIRTALLDADVSLPVVKSFIRSVQRRATGQNVLRSVSPGQLVIKIVYDELVKVLAGDGTQGGMKISNPPAVVMMVGLQGSGKTTTTAKLARRFKERENRRVLMASLDTRRPAAMEQLATLGERIGVETLPIIPDRDPATIAQAAVHAGRESGYDIVLLDTAGRLHVNDEHMDEAKAIRDVARPRETLLVVDGLTGQDAVNIARDFDSGLGISGIVLTRMDGDGRGGVALSMKAVTGKTIRFIGPGEKVADFDHFEPERFANRIPGRGDIASLV
ncbi:MAG: signal recognition particle receptor subunit alpha, partial [Rhodobacteraceae bacterium]|nr:signal recognition particle receptor subunit alpha [Paracoccaceae bacterium]